MSHKTNDMFEQILSNIEYREKETSDKDNIIPKDQLIPQKPEPQEPKEKNPVPDISIEPQTPDFSSVFEEEPPEEPVPQKNNFFEEPAFRPHRKEINKQTVEKLKKDPEVFIIFHETEKHTKNRMIPEERKEKSLSEQAEMSRKASENTSLLDGEMCFALERLDNGEKVILNKPVLKIGKSGKFSDYVITGNTAVSRRHAELITKNGKCYVRDKNSTNGTFIDGFQLPPESETEIKAGQTLTIANVEFRFWD